MKGERLSAMVSFAALKLAAGCVLLSPFIPLLFMGEEYGETAPFPYFISHTDENLVRAVRDGRRREFAGFHGVGEPPDPQNEKTFMSAKLDRSLRDQRGHHRTLHAFYRELIRLRREIESLSLLSKDHMEINADLQHRVLFVRRWSADDEVFLVLYFSHNTISVFVPIPKGLWEIRLDSNDTQWAGSGITAPASVASSGEVSFELKDYAFILFSRNPEFIS